MTGSTNDDQQLRPESPWENIRDRLRDQIEDDIMTGRLLPGSRLDEVSLAARFGVSRTPIREALAQLVAVGLVEARPRRGAFIAEIALARLIEMFEVMGSLEGMAARLAARRHTTEDRERIVAAHEACRRLMGSGDADSYFYANEEFHRGIYAASHNSFLGDQCTALYRRLRPYRRLQLRARNRVRMSFEEHQGLMEAIFDGREDAAAAAAETHVTMQGQGIGDLIAWRS